MNDFGSVAAIRAGEDCNARTAIASTLTTELEASRRELQRLRIELRDLRAATRFTTRTSANRESERLIAEKRRLDDADRGSDRAL